MALRNRLTFIAKLILFCVGILSVLYIIQHVHSNLFLPRAVFRLMSHNSSHVLFKDKPFVIWSNDYHISPINDLKYLLQPLGVKFIDKSLSGHCHITNTCEGRKTLRVINRDNAMYLESSLIPKFFDAYKNDAELLSVDAFVCFHPTSMCELFMPFNKSLLVIASTRYELGRFGKERWSHWNENLVKIAEHKANVIAGNNLYDVEYIKYFTGVQPMLLPSFCDYIPETYQPTRPGFILAPVHHAGFGATFIANYQTTCAKTNCSTELFPLRSKYAHYKYSDLTAHQGIVYVPYQVSVMSMFEQYRMNIPLFFPSVNLLAKWQQEHMVMNERTWDGVSGRRPTRSVLDPHPSQKHIPDPNNEQDIEAIRYWIKFADFYQMPHITYFESVDELVAILSKMTSADLVNISGRMKMFNADAKAELLKKWSSILKRIASISVNAPH